MSYECICPFSTSTSAITLVSLSIRVIFETTAANLINIITIATTVPSTSHHIGQTPRA